MAAAVATQERGVAGAGASAAASATAAAARPPVASAAVLRALQAARGASARCPTTVWPLLDHDGVTRGYAERLMAPLSRAEAAEADRAAGAAAAAAAAAIGGDRDDDDSASPYDALPKPAQRLRAAVAAMLRALEAPTPGGTEDEQRKDEEKARARQQQQQQQREAAWALHAADALSFARKLAAYATPWARDAGERLALGLATRCPAAREELLAVGGGGATGEPLPEGPTRAGAAGVAAHPPPPGDARAATAAIVGGALVSRAPFGSELFRRAVVSACMSLDGCTGDDFARFCGARPYGSSSSWASPPPPIVASAAGLPPCWAPCPLARLHARLLAKGNGESASATAAKEELEACRDAFLLCLGRARRSAAAAARGAGSLAPPPPAPDGGPAMPSEGYWASVAGLERLNAALTAPCRRGGAAKRGQQAAVAATVAAAVAKKKEQEPDEASRLPPPSSSVESARRAWAARPLRDPLPDAVMAAAAAKGAGVQQPKQPQHQRPRLSWRQTSADVEVRLALPLGTAARDVRVEVLPLRLSVRLSWLPADGPPALEGTFFRRVKAGEAVWTVASCGGGGAGDGGAGGANAGASDGTEAAELQLLLPKDEARRYWKGLFAGEEERGHLQLLREAVDAEETRADAAALDAAAMAGTEGAEEGGGGAEGGGGRRGGRGGGAAELLRQLRERQELVASGALDLEHGFDDFRLVLSDDGL